MSGVLITAMVQFNLTPWKLIANEQNVATKIRSYYLHKK